MHSLTSYADWRKLTLLLCTCALLPSIAPAGADNEHNEHGNHFWERSSGWWASDNTYLSGRLEQNLAAYNSLVHIEISDAQVVETTHRFYPPGNSSSYYSNGRVGTDRGIEVVTVVEMTLTDERGTAVTTRVTPASLAPPGEMTTRVLSPTLAEQRNREPESGRDNYHTLITMPTADHRYTTVYGLYTGTESDEVKAGDLRGLAVFAGRRVDASAVPDMRKRFRAANAVAAVVSPDSSGNAVVRILD